MRLLAATLCVLALGLTQATSAQAISDKNRALLAEHFGALGDVHYELYSPLGGPDVGGAVIKEGSGWQICIARLVKGDVEPLLSVPLARLGAKPPFTFLFSGKHALIYPTQDWVDGDGVEHQRGDFVIYDIAAEEAPLKLFELKDVCDLSYMPRDAKPQENLLWQPADHFLNRYGVLPRKSDYVLLTYQPRPSVEREPEDTAEVSVAAATEPESASWRASADEAAAEPEPVESSPAEERPAEQEWDYLLSQHLEALPSAATVDAANLNNRAILRYRQGRLLEASRLLTQADSVADADQSVILQNQWFIDLETVDLGEQAAMLPELPYDEALQYYWQGDYLAVLRVMEARGRSGYSDLDHALLGLALAQEERWPEADRMTAELERRGVTFLADYLWELTKIAHSQGYDDIASVRLLALEKQDRQHPGYITGWARLLQRTGNREEAEHVLETYVFDPGNANRDLTEPRLELYKLYYQRADTLGCERLERDALAGPVRNLLGYVQLADFVDFTTALTDVPLDTSGRLKAPELPLETFEIN